MAKSEDPIILKLRAKRRCPACSSNKWDRLGPIDDQSRRVEHQLTRFKCRNCKEEFLVEELPLTKFMTMLGHCGHCGSPRLKRTGEENPDNELFVCQQCLNYTVLLNHEKAKLEKAKSQDQPPPYEASK